MLEVKIPSVGESISEVQIAQWLKQEGAWVAKDENIVDLETEKASVQIPAPVSGFIRNIRKQAEEFANVGDVVCDLEPAESPGAAKGSSDAPKADAKPAPAAESKEPPRVMPAAQRMMGDKNISAEQVTATGPGGRILKEDVQRAADSKPAAAASAPAPSPAPTQPKVAPTLETNVPKHFAERFRSQRSDGRSQTAQHDSSHDRESIGSSAALRGSVDNV